METETVFYEDGIIKTYPLAYELGQQITANGSTVTMKAKVTVDPDGNTSVMPYRRDSGQRYRRLYKTRHGEVKETNEDVIVKFQFSKSQGRWKICDDLETETDDILSFLETTNDIRKWQ